MGADACVIFYGIRYEPVDEERQELETKRHPWLQAARKAGLQHYWANFNLPGERYYLFIGRRIGVFGVEGDIEAQLTEDELQKLLDDTRSRLRTGEFSGTPKLYIQWLHA